MSAKSFSVAPKQEFTYPADVMSLKIIQLAGGLSKVSDEDRSRLNFKTVKEGEDCSDMPESSRKIFLERGWILESTPAIVAAPTQPVIVLAPESTVEFSLTPDAVNPEVPHE